MEFGGMVGSFGMNRDCLQTVARLGGLGVGGVWTRYLTVFGLSVITSNVHVFRTRT